MKRLSIVIGIMLLSSSVPLWAQTASTTAARQQADEAAAKARAEEAAKARAEVEIKALAPQLPGTQGFYLDLQNSMKSPLHALQGLPYLQNGTYNVQWNSSPYRSSDPLASLQVAPGTWWNNMDTATRLSITKEQQKKMDDIFQQFRLKLIDLNAALSKEELILDPLMAAEKLDEIKIVAQIDRIALARAELEKANSRMLLGIRQSLTMEQWAKIQTSPGVYRLTSPKR